MTSLPIRTGRPSTSDRPAATEWTAAATAAWRELAFTLHPDNDGALVINSQNVVSVPPIELSVSERPTICQQ